MRYPTRESYFANRFIRLLGKTCAANEIGCGAFTLLVNVVMTEDAKRYSAAVTFTNEQLMPICGFSSNEGLSTARRKAVDAGWLHYEPGRKGVPGRYWALIPSPFDDLPDGSVDGVSIRDRDADWIPNEPPFPTGIRKESAEDTGRNQRRIPKGNSGTFIPIPNPNPREMRPRFSAPSIEAVRAYCLERKNEVDPEQFCDHYTANGWVQGKGKPIRDWRAAVRTWERNGVGRSGATTTVTKKPKPLTPIGQGPRKK